VHWINVTAAASRDDLDLLESWFWDAGAVSVTVEDAQDNPIYEPPPGAQPLWGEILVTGLFESDVQIDILTNKLNLKGFQLRGIATLEDRPWEREWLTRFKPMKFGERLWVCPTGYSLEGADKTIIQLDPGLAFGTGMHETTYLCLEFLDSIDVTGMEVVDYGCGSGILAIGAALLGAKRVTCIDNDPQALAATEENARRNDVTVVTGRPGMPLPQAELIMANILAQPLIELSSLLVEALKPEGLLVLSGIMSAQTEWVEAAYVNQAEKVECTERDGWVRMVWRR